MRTQLCRIATILIVLNVFATSVFSDAVVDTGNKATSSTGNWQISNEAKTLWATDGATFTWFFDPQPTGVYEVYMKWPASVWAAKNVSVDVNAFDGTQHVKIDQSVSPDQWNLIGTWYFDMKGSVTLTASAGTNVITFADSVWFKLVETDNGPTATIDSIFPKSAPKGRLIKFAGHGYDKLGPIVAHRWSSSIDGILSEAETFTTSNLTAGTHKISYSVKNDANNWSQPATTTLVVEAAVDQKIINSSDTANLAVAAAAESDTENIYVAQIYSWNYAFSNSMKSMLSKIGASNQTSYWRYTARGKTYYIRFISTPAALLAALKESNSHIVTGGHSNYGMGPTFYSGGQKQNNFYYVDDDHLLPVGSPAVPLNMDGMMYGQAYPNFRAIYKDGSSALMPYTANEGTPTYNYYITYQVPGDSRWYRVERANGSYIQRFADSGKSAWYSSSGAKPDPTRNPQYFITNNETYYSRCQLVGSWSWSSVAGKYGEEDGYMGACYYSHGAGSGYNKVNWNLGINRAGNYRVYASWFDDPANATNAKFTINYAGGATTITANQEKTASDFWNSLGTFYFNRGQSIITLTDSANGRVIADAIWLRPADSSTSRAVYCDNSFRYKFHYYTNSTRPNGRVIVKLKNRPNPDDLRFARMFWGTCTVDTYFLDTFHRGIVFYTNASIYKYNGVKYLELYLKGYSDQHILTEINRIEPIHEYYNFNLRPPSQR